MPNIYLRAEGVNLGSFVYDTQDLSTIRGGGLALLALPEKVEKAIRARNLVPESIIAGASVALFRVENVPDPNQLRRHVEDALRGDSLLEHATIAVDVVDDAGDFQQARALAVAKNRWRQMRMSTVVYPPLGDRATGVCEKDLLRPATELPFSQATKLRFSHGRAEKQKFYDREVGVPLGLAFSNDFNTLTANSAERGNLRDKLAVIYLDGNGFGKLQKDNCKDKGRQEKFSTGLRKLQGGLLGELLRPLAEHKEAAWWNGDDLRFETLLWGGDEIIWVVPAWQGWHVLQRFFELSRSWLPLLDQTLTHAAGLVFAHHKAPIHGLTHLAKSLAEEAKKRRTGANAFAYQVLESFDDIGRPFDEGFLKARYPFYAAEPKSLVLEAGSMEKITAQMPAARAVISRKKLHEIAKLLMTGRSKELAEYTEKFDKSAKRSQDPEVAGALACLEAFGPNCQANHARWYHLAELWDYVDPQPLETPAASQERKSA